MTINFDIYKNNCFIKSFNKNFILFILILKILIAIINNFKKVIGFIYKNTAVISDINGNINIKAKNFLKVKILSNIKINKILRNKFLIFNTSIAFFHLKKIFIKILFLYYFDLKYYIEIVIVML